MSQLSITASKHSSIKHAFCSMRDMFHSEYLDELARSMRIVRRCRKISAQGFILSSLEFISNPQNENTFTIEAFRKNYLRLNKSLSISPKCFHNFLMKKDNPKFVSAICSQALQILLKQSKGTRRKTQKHMTTAQSLASSIGVDDVILIDGTEVDVRPSCIQNFDCKGKGRKQLTGEVARPGIKLHVAFSLTKQTIEYIEVTEAVGNEKAQVLPERFKNCLLIMDRGYVSENLENKIVNSGNYYLIKGKRNTASTVNTVRDNDGVKLNVPKGVKISAIKLLDKDLLDISAQSRNQKPQRIIRARNCNLGKQNSFVFLRTNLSSETLSASKIHQLYRMRWTVELFMKALKTGNCLHSINSSKEGIILTFIALCILSSIIKTYFGNCAVHKYQTKMSLLKLHCVHDLFRDFIAYLFNACNTVYKKRYAQLLALINLNCKRTKPSARDVQQLKDSDLLMQGIIKDDLFIEIA